MVWIGGLGHGIRNGTCQGRNAERWDALKMWRQWTLLLGCSYYLWVVVDIK